MKLYRFICCLLYVYLTTVCCSLYRVEGCLPVCPPHMVLDEVTRRCVYVEDCKYPLIEFSGVLDLKWSINWTGCWVVLTFWPGVTRGGTILKDGGNKKKVTMFLFNILTNIYHTHLYSKWIYPPVFPQSVMFMKKENLKHIGAYNVHSSFRYMFLI